MASLAWADDFSYKYLYRLLDLARASFVVHPISEASPGATSVLLRHDIDVSVERALPVAELEAQLGLRATYAVMTASPLYDVRSRKSRQSVHRLTGLGHELGLHFHAHEDRPALEEDVARACGELEASCEAPVRAVSFHRPQPSLLLGPWSIGGRVNAYSRELMANYISDSAGIWRDGDPMARIASHATGPLQILVHPIWWGSRHESPASRLEAFFQDSVRGLSLRQQEELDVALARHLPRMHHTGSVRKGA